MSLNKEKLDNKFAGYKLLIIGFISFISIKIFGGNLIVERIFGIIFLLCFLIIIVKIIYFVLTQKEVRQEKSHLSKEEKKPKV